MPLVALICSANTRISHATAAASRKPTRKPGSAPGQHDAADRGEAAEPDRVRELEVPGIDRADRGERVDVHGEHHAEHDQRDLGAVPDPEPQHDQRLEPDDRQEPQHLHRRVDDVLAEPREAGDQRERGRERHADREPLDAHARSETQIALCSVPSWSRCQPLRSTVAGPASVCSSISPTLLASCHAPITSTTPSSRSTPGGKRRQPTRACARVAGAERDEP